MTFWFSQLLESHQENFGSKYVSESLRLRTEQKVSLDELLTEIEDELADLKPTNRPKDQNTQFLIAGTPDDTFEQKNNDIFISKTL